MALLGAAQGVTRRPPTASHFCFVDSVREGRSACSVKTSGKHTDLLRVGALSVGALVRRFRDRLLEPEIDARFAPGGALGWGGGTDAMHEHGLRISHRGVNQLRADPSLIDGQRVRIGSSVVARIGY